jgi:hypothetical protein
VRINTVLVEPVDPGEEPEPAGQENERNGEGAARRREESDVRPG